MTLANSALPARASASRLKSSGAARFWLFVLPITTVLAGVFSIADVTPHVVTSGVFAFIALIALVRPHDPMSKVGTVVALLVGVWLSVAIIHLAILGVPITSESTIGLSGMAILLGVATMRVSPVTFNSLIPGWFIAYMIVVVAAVMEKYFGFVPENSYLLKLGHALEDVGLASVFGNPNGFAMFLLLTCVLFVPVTLCGRTRAARILGICVQLSTVYLMFETRSRTGVTCLLVVLAVVLWQILRNRRFARVLLVFFGSTAVLVQLLTPNGVLFLAGLRDSSVFSNTDDGSFSIRFNLVRNGLMFLQDNPIIGIGPDMYEVYAQSRSNLYPTAFIINPHNGFIEILSQYGVIVGALFFVMLVTCVVSAAKLMRATGDDADRNRILGITQALLVGFLPFAATMHSTFLASPAAWLYLATMVAVGRMAVLSAGEAVSRATAAPGAPLTTWNHG